jgi:hypothetical protein
VNFRTFILLKKIGDHLIPENTAKGGNSKTLDPKDVESFITEPLQSPSFDLKLVKYAFHPSIISL